MYGSPAPIHIGPNTKYNEEDFNLSNALTPASYYIGDGTTIIDDRLRHVRSRSSPAVSIDYNRPFTQQTGSSRTPSIHSEKSRSSSSRASKRSSLLQPFYIAPRRASLGTGAHDARPPSLMSVAIGSTSFADSFSSLPLTSSMNSLHEADESKVTMLEPLQEFVDEAGPESETWERQDDQIEDSFGVQNEDADDCERLSIISSRVSRYSQESQPVFVGQAKRLTIKQDNVHTDKWIPVGSQKVDQHILMPALGIHTNGSLRSSSSKPDLQNETQELVGGDASSEQERRIQRRPSGTPLDVDDTNHNNGTNSLDIDDEGGEPQAVEEQTYPSSARLTRDALRRHDSQNIGSHLYTNGKMSTAASIRDRRQSTLAGVWARPGAPIAQPIVTPRQGSMNWVDQSPLSDQFPDDPPPQTHLPTESVSAGTNDDRSDPTVFANGTSHRRDSGPVSSLHSSKIVEDEDEEELSTANLVVAQSSFVIPVVSPGRTMLMAGRTAERKVSEDGLAGRDKDLEYRLSSRHMATEDQSIADLTFELQKNSLSYTEINPVQAAQEVAKPDISRVIVEKSLSQSQNEGGREKKRLSIWGRRGRRNSEIKHVADEPRHSEVNHVRARTLPHEYISPPLRSTVTSNGLPKESDDEGEWDPLQEHRSLQSVDYKMSKTIRLKRHPHEGLLCTYAQVGDSNGYPIMVMLGLGVTRWMIGIYDDLAAALGLRLICIDRWGTGGTDPIEDNKRSLLGWSAVIDEIATTLGIEKYSLLAHSAGAPYAIANAIAFPQQVFGSIHLLAPWTSNFDVNQTALSGYPWIKYVPSQIIGSFVKAEWGVRKNNTNHAPNQRNGERRAGSHTLASSILESSAHDNVAGSASDLLLLLRKKPFPPWGFSFEDVAPTGHRLTIWHGDKDEKIPFRDSVRLLNLVGMQYCKVRAVPGADHSLMLRVDVIMEVLESIKAERVQYEEKSHTGKETT